MARPELPVAVPVAATPASRDGERGFDLLTLAPLRALVLWSGFPYVFQAAMLIVFVTLAVLGWRMTTPDGVPAKLYAKSNLVTLLIWGLWWPSMVWAAVLLGRAWCMICPLELVSNLAERLGRRVGIRQRSLARWIASGWLIVALYATIQMFVAGAGIHRSAHFTAVFLATLLGLAFVTGLFLLHRAFCRGFCPVGLLLGTYGRGGMLAVRAAGPEKCADCDERHCLKACRRTHLDARSCPSLLNPPKLNRNRDCLVCGQCIKSCQPDNMQLLLRPPFSKRDAREPLASWPVTLFVMLASGFVFSELCAESPAAQWWFLAAPEWLAHELQFARNAGWLEGFWALFIVPVGLWSLFAAAARFGKQAPRTFEVWRRLALPLAVIVAAGHMSKGLAKFTTWAGFVPRALAAPDGVAAARAIHANAMSAPPALLPVWAVALVSIVLITVGLLLAAREAALAAGANGKQAIRAPLPVLAAMYVFVVARWVIAS